MALVPISPPLFGNTTRDPVASLALHHAFMGWISEGLPDICDVELAAFNDLSLSLLLTAPDVELLELPPATATLENTAPSTTVQDSSDSATLEDTAPTVELDDFLC